MFESRRVMVSGRAAVHDERWFQIRLGTEAHLAAVVALELATPMAPHWAPSEYLACLEWDGATGDGPSMLRRRLLVAESADGLVGFAVANVVTLAGEVTGELESVVVAESVQRRGVGEALCRAVVGWCRELGASGVELEVRSGSTGAILLYERVGFVIAGRRRGYYGTPPEDAVLMRLEMGEE